MTHPVRAVRIGRIVVRGSAIDQHDASQLPRLVAAQWSQVGDDAEDPGEARDIHGVASTIVHRASAAISAQREQR
jgi:hypothetical protein